MVSSLPTAIIRPPFVKSKETDKKAKGIRRRPMIEPGTKRPHLAQDRGRPHKLSDHWPASSCTLSEDVYTLHRRGVCLPGTTLPRLQAASPVLWGQYSRRASKAHRQQVPLPSVCPIRSRRRREYGVCRRSRDMRPHGDRAHDLSHRRHWQGREALGQREVTATPRTC